MKTAFPQTQGTCSIRLYSNIPFDNTYKHHSLISNKFKYGSMPLYQAGTAQDIKESFLDRTNNSLISKPHIYPRYDLTGDFNFNFSNGLIGSVTLELTPTRTNANYLRLTCGSDVYYYFITGITQDNFDTYTLSLELDVLMTYQDEFLEGIADKPVFTIRKHCHRYTEDGLLPYCADLKTGDATFAGVKPSIINSFNQLHFNNGDLQLIESVMWLYICLDAPTDVSPSNQYTENLLYKCKGKTYPFYMMAVPINVNSVTYGDTLEVCDEITYTTSDLVKSILSLIGAGDVHGAKISPYPPFSPSNVQAIIVLDSNRNLTIKPTRGEELARAPLDIFRLFRLTINNNKIVYGKFSNDTDLGDGATAKLLQFGCVFIEEQNDCEYNLNGLLPSDLNLINATKPTINSDRYLDPKLLFAPFKKYILNAPYSSEGVELYPELVFSDNVTNSAGEYFNFTSVATAYIGDNNFFTFVNSSSVSSFDNYRYEKIGLSTTVNYTFPTGTNALDVFNATQAQSFYQSKTASGITSGLTALGGVASIVGGVVATASGVGAPMGFGLIAGGAGAIAGGIASGVNAIKSTSAKIEDLKNTPDSINISGSNFITDECVTTSANHLPYVVVYDVTNVIKENANDYFYQYGYQVARDCYFNTQLKYFNPQTNNMVDNNLFGRSVFNYIQLNEDITNKIDNNIPLIVKQKISTIFNEGITLRSFFFARQFRVLFAYNSHIDNWFMKNTLDNTEFSGQLS